MEFQFPFNFITFLFFAFLLKLIWEWKRSKQLNAIKKLPPGPLKLPLIGNMHNLIGSLPHHALRNLARKHGPLMHLQLGEVSAIVVSSPHMAKEVMKTHDLAFASRPQLLASKIIAHNSTDIAFSPYGDYWRQMRKICIVELLSAKMVRSFASIRQDEGSRLIASIQPFAGEAINLTERVFSFTNSVVCRAAFGKVRSDQDTFLNLMKEIFSLAGGFDVADLFPSFKILHLLSGMEPKLLNLQHKVDIILDNIINEHIDNLARMKNSTGECRQEDLVDVLLRVKENGDLQFPITDKNIKAVIFDLFSAGIETSSATVEWTMSEMIRNPNVMLKAQSEIRQSFKGKKTIDDADIQGLKYLNLVIKESLRLHPPLPLLLPRESREECEIDGYKIPMKTKVIVNASEIGRDAEYWHDAESFQPERFELSPVDFTGNHFEFVPFGAGRRMCPGITFGLANVELPLALLLYHFNWRLPTGMNIRDLDMAETSGLTAARKNNLHAVPTIYDPFFP